MRKRVLCMVGVCVLLCGCSAYFEAVTPREDVLYARAQWAELEKYITTTYKGERPPFKEFFYLCSAQYELKNYGQALRCLDELVAKVEREGQGNILWHASDSVPYEIMASAYLELGQYDKALTWAQKAVEVSIRRDVHRDMKMRALAVLGLSQAFIGDRPQAEAAIREIQGFYTGYPFASSGITRNYCLSRVELALRDYAHILERPNDDWGSALIKGVAGLDAMLVYDLQNRFAKAKALYMTGKTAQARQEYQKLLAIPQFAQSGSLHWGILHDLGRMARAEHRLDEALGYQRKAVDLIEAQRANINTDAAKIGFVGDKQAVYSELISLLIEKGQTGEALEYVERGKSRALVDLLAERQSFAAQSQVNPEESLKQIASLEQKYVATAAKSGEQPGLRSAMASFAGELRQQAPELASLITVSAPRAADIQAQLGADQTLLEYYGQGDTLYAFLVTRDGVMAITLDGKGLEKDVRSFRAALREIGKDSWKPQATALYNRLVAPIAGALDKPNLIIVSHGALHYLPFNALYDGQRFLVDKVALQLLPSASVMQFLAARKPAAARDLLLLGNPDLGRADMDLPGAEAEARAIKSLWPDSTMLMRKAATKNALTKSGQLFRVIHVAAHGEFSSDQPLASRLFLAPDGTDNGQLTAGDLYGLQLNADLVTLSACETGMGKVLSGDDVVGLTRGFLYAGANNIVASLWPVSDAETTFLMTSFYGNLRKMPKAAALRQAQLETKKRYPHPFYWSAFQLTGMGR